MLDGMNQSLMNPYDLIAQEFNSARTGFGEKEYVDLLLEQISPSSRILDLGCGAGVPITAYLIERGHYVMGIDSSQAMLDLARAQVPNADFILGDMLSVELDQSFNAIVGWDSVFHIEREKHSAVFRRCHSWLEPEGFLLVSLGGSDWEGWTEMYGKSFFYSGYEPDKSIALIERSGFSVTSWEVDDPSSRGHIVVLARKGT